MSLQIRKMQVEDLSEVVDLVNRSFQPPVSMAEAFPMIFSESNTFSYLLEKDQEIVSFVGVVPSYYAGYRGVFIGAVATDPKHQGKGYLSLLFKEVMDDLKQMGLDYAFISGQRSLYRRHGARAFGSFYQYTVNEKNSKPPFEMWEYQAEIGDFLRVYDLLYREKESFPWGIQDLQQAIHYQSWAQVSSREVESYLFKDKNGELGFLSYGYGDDRAYVISSAGDSSAIYDVLKFLNFKHQLKQSIFVSKHKIKHHPFKKVPNQGTIVLWNEKIDASIFPYTAGFHFI